MASLISNMAAYCGPERAVEGGGRGRGLPSLENNILSLTLFRIADAWG